MCGCLTRTKQLTTEHTEKHIDRKETISFYDFLCALFHVRLNFDDLVKSRHSGLSGIGCLCNALKKKDSGQDGMTDSRRYGTFYKPVKLNYYQNENTED